ncbi:MAG: tRNA preQ1(34) S-adenosylmethionine ribosyltransferase-isomerase QueA [Anaerolineales bacterium]
MRTADFDYALPPEFIAQRPAKPRDTSRLLVLDRRTGERSHHRFHELPGLLNAGDVLVINQTKVIPARLHALKVPTGGRVELLLLKRLEPQIWEVLVGGRGLKPGRKLTLADGLQAEITQDLGGACRMVRFEAPIGPRLAALGEMPLPPYIHTPLHHPDEYQTVFAQIPASSAAPTAGLHFTPSLLTSIEQRGVHIVKLTLHIGLDTFAPVTEEDPATHPIHSEWCQLGPEQAEILNTAAAAGGRVVAVGTSAVRTLETAAHAAAPGKRVAPVSGPTDLYILPGFDFRAVDAMVTNFHLPRSTLLMLVSAFAGRERILETYEEAMHQGYRFYSFGDAMLIL